MTTTPSQTVGPFFTLGLRDHPCPNGPVRLEGRVLDGAGAGVPDAMVEVWSPVTGWGRCATDRDGRYSFAFCETRHVDMQVFARGLLKQVRTRVTFDQDAQGRTFDIRLQDDTFFVV
jgi:protocatechuate 3,4-dioxygenase, alpha subunit